MSRHTPNRYGLKRTRQGEAAKNFQGTVTRQQKRATLRTQCFAEITEKFGPEPRSIRRSIAHSLAVRRFKNRKAMTA